MSIMTARTTMTVMTMPSTRLKVSFVSGLSVIGDVPSPPIISEEGMVPLSVFGIDMNGDSPAAPESGRVIFSRGEVLSTAPPILLSGMFVPSGIISDISGIVSAVSGDDVAADAVIPKTKVIIKAAIMKQNNPPVYCLPVS